MKLRLDRIASDDDSTIGVLSIDGKTACYILEDQHATQKVWGEMRIPAGTYQISLRKEGTFHSRYSAKFPDIHKGMLCIHNAPDWKIVNGGIVFQYVLIHIGNTDDDTAGCLLTGAEVARPGHWQVARSTDAYRIIYPVIANHLAAGGSCTIEVRDLDMVK